GLLGNAEVVAPLLDTPLRRIILILREEAGLYAHPAARPRGKLDARSIDPHPCFGDLREYAADGAGVLRRSTLPNRLTIRLVYGESNVRGNACSRIIDEPCASVQAYLDPILEYKSIRIEPAFCEPGYP